MNKIIGLDLPYVSVDGSLHKSPIGGEGTGANPTDRGKLGLRWSIIIDLDGIPLGVAIDGANRNDSVMLTPTLDDVVIAKKKKYGAAKPKKNQPMGLRWPVEWTNSWFSNLHLAPQEHRLQGYPPPRPALTRHRIHSHSQADRLAESLVTASVTYPLRLLGVVPFIEVNHLAWHLLVSLLEEPKPSWPVIPSKDTKGYTRYQCSRVVFDRYLDGFLLYQEVLVV